MSDLVTQLRARAGGALFALALLGVMAMPSFAVATPTVTATKEATTAGGPGGSTTAGGTIDYKVTIKNTSGSETAVGVSLTDPPPGHTVDVAGSLKVSPLAFPDAYDASKNNPLHVNATPSGLLANDKGLPTPSAVANSGTTSQNGGFTVFTDGSFDYNPPNNFTGTDTFTYTVTNTQLPNDTATVTLTVQQAPVITSANNTAFKLNTAGTFTVTTTGFPTGASMVISETGALPGGVSFVNNNDGTATLAGTPTASGSFPITITANNGVTPNATQNFTLTVQQTPAITSANNTTFKVGTAGTFSVTTTGFPTNASMAISETGALPSGVTFVNNNNGTATLAGTPAVGTGGTYPLTITASNGVSPDATQSFTLTVQQAPAITSANNTTFKLNTAGTFTVTTTGFPTNASMAISETGALPGGVSFVNNNDGTATLAGTPTASGSFPITITANNGVTPNATQNFTLTVQQAPAITSANNTTFKVGTAGTFSVTTTGFPTNASMAISEAGALPSGVTFVNNNNGTATLAGTPAAGTGGTYPLTITASNGVTPDATQSFTLTVQQAPAITSANNVTFTTGIAGTFSVTTTGFPTNASMVISESGALPGGVTFVNNNDGTATLAGTPGANTGGTYPLVITANNGVTPNATQNFTLTVNQPPVASADNPGIIDANTTLTGLSSGPTNLLTNDSRGFPIANISSYGGGSMGGSVTDHAAGTTTTPLPTFASGSIVVNANGSYTFTPPTGFTGTYTFQYRLSNVAGNSDATVTVQVRPKAVNDTFGPPNVIGNVSIDIATSVFLANDIYNSPVTFNLVSNATAQGGSITIAGSTLTYNPPRGYEGADTFTYTITDNSTFTSTSATVTMNVSGMIWFINNNAGACSSNCDGRLSNPYTTLAAFNTANALAGGLNPDINDNIFVYESAAGYSGAVTLRTGQKLIGQDATATLATITGLTVPSGSTLPAMNSGNATVTNITTSTVTLNTNTTVRGLQINSTTSTGMNDPGAAITGVSVSEVSIATTSGTGVVFSGTAGTLTFTGLTTSGGTGANLVGNGSGTFNFSNVVISSGVNAGFIATGGGTVNVTGATNTITTTTGTGVNIATPTDIGGSGVTFKSVTVSNGASNSAVNGIILNGTTGAFTVTGDGATSGGFLVENGTGGTIQKTTGDAVSLTNASNVTLRQMRITSPALDGVKATGGGTIKLSAVFINTPGASNPAAGGDGFGTGNGVRLENVTGVNAMDNNSRITNWQASQSNAFLLHNTGTNFTSLTFDHSKIDTSATGAPGFHSNLNGATTGAVTITNTEFTLIDQNAAQVINNGSGTIRTIVQGNNFHDADGTAGDGNNTLFLSNSHEGHHNFTIGGAGALGNTFHNLARLTTLAGVVQVDCAGGDGSTPAGGTINGTITNNNIWNDAGFVNGRRAIDVQVEADSHNLGQLAVAITNNTVNNVQGNAIHVSVVSVGGGSVTDANWTITGNSLGAAGTNNGIRVGLDNTDSSSAIEFETNVDVIASSNAVLGNKLLVSGNTGVNSANNATGGTLDITNIGSSGASGSATLHATITNNTLTNVDTAGTGHVLDVLNSSASSHETLNLNITGNNTTLGASAAGEIRLRQLAGTYNIQGGIAAVSANNSGDTVNTTGTFGTVGSVLTPTNPSFLILAPGGIDARTPAASFSSHPAIADEAKLRGIVPAFPSAIQGVADPRQQSRVHSSGILTQERLDSLVAAAIARWQATGLTARQLGVLLSLKFEVGALAALHLGEANGNLIRVDKNGGGNGWFVGNDDAQFATNVSGERGYTDPTSAPAGRIDLLTTIMHEMGHALGLPDSYDEKDRDKVMYGFLTTGERRVPAAGDAVGAKPNAQTTPQFLASPAASDKYTIGDIPPGKTVVVTFQVQVENPLSPTSTTQISNQGTVSGTNFATVNGVPVANPNTDSDNPPAGAADPTITLLCANPATVTTNADAGAGSLRQALIDVCDGGTITFSNTTAGGAVNFYDGSPHTITLASELVVGKNVTINGPGANVLTVGGNNIFRLVNITLPASGTATIQGLSFTGGRADPAGAGTNGGAIEFNSVGTLNLNNCEFFANTKTAAGDVIFSSAAARLNINGCAFRNNTTEVVIHIGSTPATIVNSTISNNTALAVRVDGGPAVGVTNCTIANNSVGGIGLAPGGGGTVTLTNTILSQNNGNDLTRTDADCSGNQKFNSGGHNLIDDATSSKLCNSPQPGDLLGAAFDPLLGSLAGNGGPTQTRLPALGSQVTNAAADWTTLSSNIDNVQTTITVADPSGITVGSTIRIDLEQMSVTAVVSNTLTVTRGANATTAAAHTSGAGVSSAFDQRGFPRKVGAAVDIGAVETNFTITTTAGTPQSTKVNTAFPVALQATVKESGTALSGVSVTFTPPASNVASGTATTNPATTNGSGVASTAFTANAIAGGPYIVAASVTGLASTADFSLTNTPPTVTIDQASGQADPTAVSPINFTVVFSDPVTGFGSGGVTLSGTANPTAAVVTGSGTTYNVAVSGMTAQPGTVIATVNAGAATDGGSNANLASTSTDNTVTYDTPPSVTINQASGQADPTNVSPINFTVVFSEAVTGFGSGGVDLSGTANPTTAVVTGSGTTYNVAVSGMSAQGTVIASVKAGAATDPGLNPNTASTSTDNTVIYDSVQPTVAINQASGQADPTNISPINFTVVFSEAVTGFGSGSVTLSGTAGATTKVVTGSGNTYNVAVSGMTGDGTVIATVPAGGATDAAGNTNAASTSADNTVTYDTTKPDVTINQASGQADPTNASPINFTVVFTEAVTGFGSGSVTLSGTAGATTKVVTGSGTTYNVAVSGMTSDGTVIATVPAGGAADATGNTNNASSSTDNTVTYDVTNPSVTINQASGQADPTNASPINFTVVFSEAVTGFGSGGVTLSGAANPTTAVVTGSGTTYNVAVSGMSAQGTVIASVKAGAAIDSGSNPNTASTSTDNTVTYDSVKPAVMINQASSQADPTNASPINFTVVFSEAVTGFGSGSVTLSGTAGATTKVVTGSGNTYNVAVSGMTSDGTVIATVPAGGAADAAGNTNAASTSADNTVTYDTTKPDVTINQASGQADPAGASPINFTVVFTESVTGFGSGSVTLSGTAGATTKVVTGSGTTYNVAVSGMTSDGTVIATIPAGGAADAAGNTNSASSSTDNTVTYDGTKPSVTINQASGQPDPSNASPINFTVVFTESVTGFGSGSVILSGTAGATTKVVTGSGTTYNVAVSGMTSDGTVIATVPAGGATDASGNTNTVSTSTDNTVTYDTLKPAVMINQASTQADPTNASPINFTVVFSEAVTGFGSGSVTLSGTAGATTKVVTGSGTTYNVAVGGMTSDGTVIAAVPAGGAADAAGNTNAASTSADNTVTYDTTKPDVTINQASGQPDPTNASPINFTVVFAEAVTGFGSGSVTLSGTAGATTKVVTGSGTTYNVAVSGMTSNGTVIATVPAGGAADAAGNTNNASSSTDNTVTYDGTKPGVTINQASGQADPANASPINFTVVFSEPVTGFTGSGVTLSGTAGATSKVVTGSGATYNVAVSGMTSQGTVIATVAAGSAADTAGNTNTVSSSTDNTVTYDNVQPSVSINQASGQTDPTNASPINFTVVFSESVTGFGSGSVTLSGTAGATTKVVTGSGTTYNVAVSGMTSNGTVIATVPAGGAADAAGNTNTVSTSTDNSVNYDSTQPSVTINQAAAQSDPANASPINFTVVFSKPVAGFGSSGVALSGTAGATTKVVTGSGATYNVAVSGMTSDGTVIATVPAGSAADSANNTNTASTSTDNTVTYDTGNPSVTINQASGQVDPTNASPINFTVVFSEVVTGFSGSGVTLSGTAGATSKVVTGSGTTYNVAVSGMTSQGTVIASVAAGAAADGAGNTNNTSTSTDNTVTYDNVQPSVTINQASTQSDPTNASPINFTVVFSESVTGFSASGVTLSGTAGATSKVVTGSGTTYNVAVSGMTSQGTVIATVPAGGAADGAGNTNGVSTSTDNTVTYDNVQPSVTINQAAGQADPTTSSPINFTVVFSEPVSGFGSSGVTLSGTAGATAKVVTGSGTTYNVAVSGMTSQGTVTATVPAGGSTDAAGNTSTVSTSTDNTVTFNTLATHFTVTAPASAIPGTSFTFTVAALDQFNNPPTNYPGTVHFSSTDAAGILPVDSTLSGGTGTFNATLTTPGSQTITATDTGNSTITGTSNAIAVGKTNPTIITQASTGINLGAGTISDAATLAGGSAPTGSITFRLYGPNDATCGGAAVFTSAAIPVNGNATYSSGNFTPTAPGTYRWIASYSGDTANNAVAGACNDANESVVVTKANPAITGTVAPATGNIGTSFTDTATLSAGTNPTGTITFTVHGPNIENCATPIFTSTRTVAGNANYTSDAFTPTLPGSYKFVAVYNGDANNNSVATICGVASQTFVVNGPPPSPTPTPTATPAQALNISTRMRTELGDKAMIGGFIITGNASKSVVLRGLGPSLSSFGLSDLLLDPELELRGPNNNLIFKNKNWKDDQLSQIEGTNFEPKDERESVIVITLNAGAYTVLLTGKDGTEGIGLVEIYDTNPAAASELGNISTRGMVRTDDKVMIGGFTLGGPNNATRIAVRGRGPSLSQFNLSPLLANPVLELRNENGTIMVVNDDWQSDPVSAANLTANGLGLSDPKESGIFISLTPPGQFTAILSGKDGGIGIGLVEIYNLK
ncbi:MAG: hypothetical protein QOF24_230 [Verrucomicrobiota bacterium]